MGQGSGGADRRPHFASLVQAKLLRLRKITQVDDRGPNPDPGRDIQAPHCTFNLNPRASSIDTRCTIARGGASITPTRTPKPPQLARVPGVSPAVYGGQVAYTPLAPAGLELGLGCADRGHYHPAVSGV